MKRLSLPFAIVASLAIAGPAVAAKPPSTLAVFNSNPGVNEVSIVKQTSVRAVVTQGFANVSDSTWPAYPARPPLSEVDFGASIKKGSTGTVLVNAFVLFESQPGYWVTSLAQLVTAECERWVSSENLSCPVTFYGVKYDNWDALVAAHPTALINQAPWITVRAPSDVTLVGVDLR